MREDPSDDSLDDMIRLFKQIEKELNKFFEEAGIKAVEEVSSVNGSSEDLSLKSGGKDPLVDVLGEGDKISVLIDVCGFKAEDIRLELIDDHKLRILTPLWSREVDLKAYVDPSKVEVRLNNTVLLVTLVRKRGGRGIVSFLQRKKPIIW